MNFETITLPVKVLEVCSRTRVRKVAPQANSDIVIEYAEAYRHGLILEPLDVFREKGTERYIVADGEHRLLALNREKIAKVECRLYEGDEVDALEFATRCNQRHGLRRSKDDVYHAFVRIKETPRLAAKFKTDNELSYQLGVSYATIQRYQIKWRDSDGGNAEARAAKESARERAAKHNGADHREYSKRNHSISGSTMPASNGSSTYEQNGPSGSQQSAQATQSADGTPPVDGQEPSAEERAEYEAEMERESREYFESIDRVMQSDDRLTAAQAEIRRLGQVVEITERSRDGFMNGKAAVTELLKKEQATTARQSKLIDRLRAEIEQLKTAQQESVEADALRKQVERLTAENEKLRERIAIMEEAA